MVSKATPAVAQRVASINFHICCALVLGMFLSSYVLGFGNTPIPLDYKVLTHRGGPRIPICGEQRESGVGRCIIALNGAANQGLSACFSWACWQLPQLSSGWRFL